MKILMLNHEFPPVGGGASPVALELCRHLVRLGHRVDAVTMHFGQLPRVENLDGVRIYRTPALRKRADICHTHEMATFLPGALPTTLKLARREKYDIIHCHFIIPGGPLAWLASRCRGIPLVITGHGSDVPGYNPERFGLDHKLLKPVWHFLVHRAALLVSPSESLKNLIQAECPRARVEIIPNGINLTDFRTKKKNKDILLCSRLLGRKGFQYALEAIGQTDFAGQVHVVGDGPMLSELKNMAAGMGATVRFWGWLDKEDPRFRQLYAESGIFIFPSEAENFPMVLLEAMAAGMAIITSTAGGCPEVVGDSALLVKPRNSLEIKEQLQKLLNEDSLCMQLGESVQRRVEQFRWTAVAKKYAACYQNVLDHSCFAKNVTPAQAGVHCTEKCFSHRNTGFLPSQE